MSGVPAHIRALNKARHLKRLDNAEVIGRLYSQGLNMREIAEKLGINRWTVEMSLKLISKIWRERLGDSIDRHRAEQLAKIDRIEAEAWAGWERSKRAALELKKLEETGKFSKSVTSKIKKYRDGEVRFLELASRQVEMRSKLLGLDKPESTVSNATPLLEVIVTTRAEAAKMLPYMDFANEIVEGQVVESEGDGDASSD